MSSPGPTILGRYALYDAIASGGMASIYLGRLLGPVGFSRTVAIKRLHEQFARDPEFVAGFLDEARIAARIRHPNVVPTIDVVALEHEIFLVMEFIQGESLAHLLKKARVLGQPPPLGVITKIASDMLQGLHAAHEARSERGEPLGIVHRDVSPQNILVGQDGVARVVDFGIAKALGRMGQTREGQIKGKVPYMAPEQITAKGVDRGTDIYAASVVLWEALAGQRMVQTQSDVEAMYQILEADPPPPSEMAPGLPAALDDVVMRGLRKKRSERFSTTREMALALDAAAPMASSAAVSDWVQQLAGERLAQRSEQITLIESQQTDEIQAAQTVRTSTPSLSTVPATAADEPLRTSLDHITSTTASVATRKPTQVSSGAAIVVAAGLLISGGAFVVGRMVRNGSTPEPAAVVSAAPSAAPPEPTASAAAEPAPPAASASARPSKGDKPKGDKPRGDKARGDSPAARPPATTKPSKAPGADIYQRD